MKRNNTYWNAAVRASEFCIKQAFPFLCGLAVYFIMTAFLLYLIYSFRPSHIFLFAAGLANCHIAFMSGSLVHLWIEDVRIKYNPPRPSRIKSFGQNRPMTGIIYYVYNI